MNLVAARPFVASFFLTLCIVGCGSPVEDKEGPGPPAVAPDSQVIDSVTPMAADEFGDLLAIDRMLPGDLPETPPVISPDFQALWNQLITAAEHDHWAKRIQMTHLTFDPGTMRETAFEELPSFVDPYDDEHGLVYVRFDNSSPQDDLEKESKTLSDHCYDRGASCFTAARVNDTRRLERSAWYFGLGGATIWDWTPGDSMAVSSVFRPLSEGERFLGEELADNDDHQAAPEPDPLEEEERQGIESAVSDIAQALIKDGDLERWQLAFRSEDSGCGSRTPSSIS